MEKLYSKKFSEKNDIIYTFANLFILWLYKRQLDSLICFCLVTCFQLMYMKKVQIHTDIELECGRALCSLFK